MPGPLEGVRVLDLTGVVSGPFATMFLADQGADVIKIEPISGDITRRSRAAIDKAGEFSALFISSNRGKRSLAVDIKSDGRPRGTGQTRRTGRRARAEFPARARWSGWASAPTNCAHSDPRLIYVSISGVGETGPYAKKRVYDPIVQGLSGFADIQAQPVTNRPQMIRTIVADKTTAIVTAQAVSSALYAREKTGRGDHIQVAMLDVDAFLSVARRNDRNTPSSTPRRRRPIRTTGRTSCSRRRTATSPAVPSPTPNGRDSAGPRAIPELATDARFATPTKRSVNATARIHKMAGIHRPAHDGGVAGTSGRGGRTVRADPAPQRDHRQRTGGCAADHRGA